MAKEHKTVKEMWEKYLSTIGENINDSGKTYESWYFCNNEKDAHELAALVKKRGGEEESNRFLILSI